MLGLQLTHLSKTGPDDHYWNKYIYTKLCIEDQRSVEHNKVKYKCVVHVHLMKYAHGFVFCF